MPSSRVLLWSAVCLLLGCAARSEPDAVSTLGVGDTLPALTLEDQHGVARSVDASVRVILFSRDMDGGGVIRAVLDEETLGQPPAAFLEANAALCVADVHRMPSLIRRTIAKPRMRQRPYPLLLDESGAPTQSWPSRGEHATLLRLDGLRVLEVSHFSDPAELGAALGIDPKPQD